MAHPALLQAPCTCFHPGTRVGVSPQCPLVSSPSPRVSQGWTQEATSKAPIPTDLAGQQEQPVGRRLHQLRPNWLVGCIRHTHRFRHHLYLCPIYVKVRPVVHRSTPNKTHPPRHQPNQPPCKKSTAETSSSQETYQPRNSTSEQPTSLGTSYYFIILASRAIFIHLGDPHFHALDVLYSLMLGFSFRKIFI